MPDRAALFSEILAKNSLRRSASLPLYPVSETYMREVEAARWREIVEEHWASVEAEILAEKRAKHGPEWGYSAGGRWLLTAFVEARLRERFGRKR